MNDQLSEEAGLASIRSLYLAVTEIASDNECPTFSEKIAVIANRAGVSSKTATRYLDKLESLKLIAVDRQTRPGTSFKAPNRYTILSLSNCVSSNGNGARALGNNDLSNSHEGQQWSITDHVEEHVEKHNEELGEESHTRGESEKPEWNDIVAANRELPNHPKTPRPPLDDYELKRFFTHFDGDEWLDKNGKPVVGKRLLAKLLSWTPDRVNGRRETVLELEARIRACNDKISQLQRQTYKETPVSHPVVRPEAVNEIKAQRALIEGYKRQIRGEFTTNGSSPSRTELPNTIQPQPTKGSVSC